MENTKVVDIVAYLNKQKACGKKEVFRTSIFNVLEYRSGRMFSPKDLPTGMLVEAAALVGGSYLPGKNGNSKVVFN